MMGDSEFQKYWDGFIDRHGETVEAMRKTAERIVAEGNGDDLAIWDLVLQEHRRHVFSLAANLRLIVAKSRLTLSDILDR